MWASVDRVRYSQDHVIPRARVPGDSLPIGDPVEVLAENLTFFPEDLEVLRNPPEVLPENLKVLGDQLEVFAENFEVLPQNLRVLRDQLEVSPENLEVLPDRIEVLAENLEVLPEHPEVLPDQLEVLPQNLGLFPHHLEVLPEDLEVLAENLQVLRDQVEVFPKNLDPVHPQLEVSPGYGLAGPGAAHVSGGKRRLPRLTSGFAERGLFDMLPRLRTALGSLAVCIALAGCGTSVIGVDAATPVDAHDAGPPGPSHAYTYVIDQITIDPTDDPSVPHTGFNLDGLFSSATDPNGCLHQDFFSGADLDQNCPTATVNGGACATPGCALGDASGCTGGVDNQFPTLANTLLAAANTDIRQTFAALLQNNQLSLLLRVTGITDDTNSPSVTVQFYLAYPTFTDGCASVLPGREYSVSQSSLTAGGTTIDDAAYVFPGRIVNGRLQTDAQTSGQLVFPLPPIMGHRINLPLQGVQIRADVAASGLSTGGLGGWVSGSDVFPTDGDCCGPSYPSVVASVIAGLVDIEVNNVCDDDTSTPHVYGGISLGFGLHAVPATISATMPIADAPALGTCANPLPDAGVDASQSADGG